MIRLEGKCPGGRMRHHAARRDRTALIAAFERRHDPFCRLHPALLGGDFAHRLRNAPALDVTLGPEARNEVMCGLSAQEMFAHTAIRPKDGEYIKIACVHRRVVAEN